MSSYCDAVSNGLMRYGTAYLTRMASTCPILSYMEHMSMCSCSTAAVSRTTNLVSFHGLDESSTSSLLLAFDQHNEVNPKRTTREQVRSSTCDSHDRSLVVSSASAIEVSVASNQREGI